MIELRCLGSVDLRAPEQNAARRVIAQPKRYALLVYLAIAKPRGFHRRDTLIALFWPEADEDHARSGLRRSLSFLRRELGDSVIVTHGDDVAVNPDAINSDVIDFESALETGLPETALSLYHGDLLPGLHISASVEFERWLDGERERLRRCARDAAFKLSNTRETAGDWKAAVKWQRFASDLAPDDESVLQRLIQLLDSGGDRAAALREFESFAERMRKELDAEPSPKTQAMIDVIRTRAASSVRRDARSTSLVAINDLSAPSIAAAKLATTPPLGRSQRRGFLAAFGLAAIMMVLASSTIYWRSSRAAAAPSPAVEATPSLAVLPFDNLGSDKDAYFSAGITDEISSKLSAIGGLTVIGRQSAKGYANTSKSPREIGKELGARYLLTGTVRWDRSRAGHNLVKVTPVLVRASDGAEMWSEPYEREATSIFDIQEMVAERVAGELRLKLSRSERQSLTRRPTNSAEAYDYFLRGRSLGSSTHFARDLLRAIAFYERAVQLDPKFAVAYAELGRTHLQAFWFVPDGKARRLEMARAAIDTAISLEPNLAAAHLARATYYYRGKNEFQRALEALIIAERLSPNDADVANLKGAVERRQNRWAEAIADQQRAFRLDPRNDRVIDNLCGNLVWVRNFADAERVCSQLVVIAPEKWLGYGAMYHLAVHRGDVQRALAIARQAETRVDPEEFLDGLLDDGGWPAFLDPHLLSLMDAVHPRLEGPDAHLSYATIELYLNVYKKDSAAARRFADSILVYAPKMLNGTFSDAVVHENLALAYAAKGDKRHWLEHAQLSLKILPISVDAAGGTANACNLVNSAVLVGAYDEALSRLKYLLAIPSGISVESLRVDPWFDPLRKDPRFQALLAANQ